jgi:hypothetical protein
MGGMLGMALGRGKRILLGAGLVLVVAAVVAWRAFHVPDLMRIGVGYTAQQTCACLFVGRRPLESCTTDLDPLARRLMSVRVEPDGVTASAFGLASATARFEKGYGCSLRD